MEEKPGEAGGAGAGGRVGGGRHGQEDHNPATGPGCGCHPQVPGHKDIAGGNAGALPRWATEAGAGELTLTLYPEALTCSPLLVRVDFMRMKKERSWTREKGGTSAALASGVGSEGRLRGPEEKTHTGPPCPQYS